MHRSMRTIASLVFLLPAIVLNLSLSRIDEHAALHGSIAFEV